MTVLNRTLCYLAGSIENATDAESWRNILSKKLSELGVISLDPTKQFLTDQISENEELRTKFKQWRADSNWKELKSHIKEIIRRDLRVIDYSTFCIFKIEPLIASWGTGHELTLASLQRKPILILIDKKENIPIWLIGLVNMDFVFESIEELMTYLIKVNSGEIKVDGKYWKFLIPELR